MDYIYGLILFLISGEAHYQHGRLSLWMEDFVETGNIHFLDLKLLLEPVKLTIEFTLS